MDSVCHIYKQMRAPYCFDIKIGIERTDARTSVEEEKKGSKKGVTGSQENKFHIP